ncbi:MAG: nickel pincer cofactor biosynthesis protein LarC [Candidatus Velthaea sp.]
MKCAYVEMIGGASGNMLLGALIDAGADADALECALRTIPVEGWSLERSRTVKRGIAATYVGFAIAGEDCAPGERAWHGRHLADVLDIIAHSRLSARVRERASAIYRRLGEAEAHVHGTTVDDIHFYEIGQVDAILDVAGVCAALEMLGVERLACSAYPVGRGSIDMHHGRYPNPPPATAELMRGAPTAPVDVDGEMVTTTAAAILATLVPDPGTRPAMTFERIGYGAGRSDFAVPNVTRVIVGDAAVAADGAAGLALDEVAVLETNVDDMAPHAFELAVERLFAAGALDVWTAPIAMKKNRPAVMLAALAPPALAAACAQVMLRETSTLGVRTRREARYLLPRELRVVTSPYGDVRIKVARAGDSVRATLEYDDVARIARERGLPLADVVRELQPLAEARIGQRDAVV